MRIRTCVNACMASGKCRHRSLAPTSLPAISASSPIQTVFHLDGRPPWRACLSGSRWSRPSGTSQSHSGSKSNAVSIVPTADAIGFTREVQRLIGDEDDRRRLADRSRSLYETLFSAPRIVSALRNARSQTRSAA